MIDGGNAARIDKAVEAVLATDAFQRAPSMRRLLTHLVDAARAGDDSALTAYAIGAHALNRGRDFDPSADPVVRVECARLRRMLEAHEAGEGAGSDMRIVLPRGSYRLQFLESAAAESPPAPAPEAPPTSARARAPSGMGRAMAGVLLVLAGVGALVAWIFRDARTPAPRQEIAATRSLPADARGAGGYWLKQPVAVVEPFAFPEGDALARAAAEQAGSQLRDALARFERLTVLAAEERPDAFDAAVNLAARVPDYRIQGRFSRSASRGLVFNGRIVDGEGRVLTTRSFSAPSEPFGPGVADWLDDFVAVSAMRIGSPFGILASEEWRRRRAQLNRNEDPYTCTLMVFEHWREDDPQLVSRAIRCLTRVVEEDPSNAPVLALLAEAEVMAWRHGRTFGDGAPSVERALARARRAVELMPNAAFPHLALFSALQPTSDARTAIVRGRQALALNPNDAYVVASVGFYLIKQGFVEEGAKLMGEERLGSLPMPTWVHGARGLAAYMAGDVAATQAEIDRGGDSMAFINRLMRYLVEMREGDSEAAADIWRRLPADMRASPREALRRRGFAPPVVARLEPYLPR